MVEVVMIICLAVVLFILIRRFPDTAKAVSDQQSTPKVIEEIKPAEKVVEKEAVPQYSEAVEALLLEAKKLIDENKSRVAEDKLIEAIQEDLHCAPAYTLLGDIYLQRKRLGESEESYQAALRNDDRQAGAHFGLASIFEENGRTNEAVKEAQKAIKIDSTNDLWYKKLADLYMELRVYAKAEMAYRKAENLRPDYAHYKELAILAGKKQLSHKVGR